MRRWLPALLLLPLIACGSGTTISPSPVPVPSPQPAPAPQPTSITITGTLTDTVSHAVIGSFSQTVPSLPAMVTVNAPGHLERQTRIGSSTPTVDLIPSTAPFSSIFYGQLVRDMLESTTPETVHVLPFAPRLYLQTAGLSVANIDHLIAAARDVVPLMTGNRYVLAAFETGPDPKPETDGWIVVDIVNEGVTGNCGRAYVGRRAGHIWFNIGDPKGCTIRGDAVSQIGMRHEMGHALGFFHIDVPNSLMNGTRSNRGDGLPLEAEKYHAAIAYHREAGNRDPDVDSPTSTPLRAGSRIVVVD